MALQSDTLRYAIGVDVGGSKIACGIVDDKGALTLHKEVQTDVTGGAKAVEKQILTLIDTLRKESVQPIKAIGIGAAGQVDAKTESIVFAPNLYWHNVPLASDIEKALKIPTRCLNDVRAITLAEWRYGAGKGYDDIVCVFIGTGIGSGIVSGGRLQKGCSNTFGEIGHMVIDINGPTCTCGRRGCLDAIAGGRGIAAKVKAFAEENGNREELKPILARVAGNSEAITAKVVLDAYAGKDPFAMELMEEVVEALIVGLSNVVNICNPHRLILGGGIADAIPDLLQRIQEGIAQHALKAATARLEIVSAHFGREAGMIGAATYALHIDELNHRQLHGKI